MKQKLISTVGLVATIGLFVLDCGLSIHNLGCDVFGQGSQYFERTSFSWGGVRGYEWLFWGVSVLWYFILLFPWIKYFNDARKNEHFRKTPFGERSFTGVFMTVFNLILVLCSTIYFIRTGTPDALGLYADMDDFWRDMILVFVLLAGKFYIIIGIILSAVIRFRRRCQKNNK